MSDAFYTQDLKLLENSLNLAHQRATSHENSARPAVSEHTIISTGTGQTRVKSPILFSMHFREQPHFTSGCLTVKNPYPKVFHDPVGQTGVWAWKRDGKGYYVGAYVWWRVDSYMLDTVDLNDSGAANPVPAMQVEHHLSFSAVGFKDLPKQGLTDETLTPRASGLITVIDA